MESKNAKVYQLKMENFGPFINHSINFSGSINVLIGKNSTGKTIIMKLLYSILSTINEYSRSSERDMEVYLRDKIKSVFLIERIGRLVTRGVGVRNCSIELVFDSKQSLKFSLSTRGDNIEIRKSPQNIQVGNPIYIPPKEILSLMDRGIIGTLEEKKNLMEGVYLDLAKKLDVPLSTGPYDDKTKELLNKFKLKDLSRISRENKEFYVSMKNAGGKLESKLLAEGYRKLATIIYLIKNGQISEGNYLFWDEPEANLNPALSELTVDLLIFLARRLGVQVFVSTHDYFIMKYFDLKNKKDKLELKFISLYFSGDEESPSSLSVKEANSLYDIENNPIFKEFERILDIEASILLEDEKYGIQ